MGSEKSLIRQYREHRTLESDIFGVLFREMNVFPAENLGKTPEEVIQKYMSVVAQFCNGAKELSKLPYDAFCKFVDTLVESYKDKNLKFNGEVKTIKNDMLALYEKYALQKDGNGVTNGNGAASKTNGYAAMKA